MLHARKHRKVSMAKVSEQKSKAESFQLLSASRVASQVPCEPKQMWRPKQKAMYEASGVATSQVRLSHEEKGKIPACFIETVSREVTTATMPSPNSGAVTPRASLILMSEATDGVANTVPQGTHEVPSRQARTGAPSSTPRLPQKDSSYFHYHKDHKYNGVPNSTISSTRNF